MMLVHFVRTCACRKFHLGRGQHIRHLFFFAPQKENKKEKMMCKTQCKLSTVEKKMKKKTDPTAHMILLCRRIKNKIHDAKKANKKKKKKNSYRCNRYRHINREMLAPSRNVLQDITSFSFEYDKHKAQRIQFILITWLLLPCLCLIPFSSSFSSSSSLNSKIVHKNQMFTTA